MNVAPRDDRVRDPNTNAHKHGRRDQQDQHRAIVAVESSGRCIRETNRCDGPGSQIKASKYGLSAAHDMPLLHKIPYFNSGTTVKFPRQLRRSMILRRSAL